MAVCNKFHVILVDYFTKEVDVRHAAIGQKYTNPHERSHPERLTYLIHASILMFLLQIVFILTFTIICLQSVV